ncbi:FCD domain-containing protein [Streptomyces sp. NPDC094472]|uniref:FCD domain-containing protein n=1 Tax=Streptomyces sp. NPDC094472 TaxID=3155080 RepID=UPI00332200AB
MTAVRGFLSVIGRPLSGGEPPGRAAGGHLTGTPGPSGIPRAYQRAKKDDHETSTASDLNEANRLLHVAIAEVARVSLMIPMINTLHEEIERFLNLRGELGRPPYTSVNHGRLVETIRRGSEEEIRQVVLEGIERSRQYMLETLLSGGNETSGASSMP